MFDDVPWVAVTEIVIEARDCLLTHPTSNHSCRFILVPAMQATDQVYSAYY